MLGKTRKAVYQGKYLLYDRLSCRWLGTHNMAEMNTNSVFVLMKLHLVVRDAI